MPSSYLNTILEDILEQHGISWCSEHQRFVHLLSRIEFAHIQKENGLKVLDVHPNMDAHLHDSSTHTSDLGLLHKRLAHLHNDGICELLKQQGIAFQHTMPSM